MRLIGIGQSLWLDEAIGAEAVRNFSFRELLLEFPKFDNHPPLYYLDLKSWTLLLGFSEFGLRLPSVIYGVGTVFITYLIAQKISKNKFFQYSTALLLATSQIHIYYSQEARMYSLASFLASLSIYSFVHTLDVYSDSKVEIRGPTSYWYLFSFSIVALIFTDYVPVFLLPVFWIVPLLYKKAKTWWKKLMRAHLPLIILGLMWLPVFKVQSEKGRWLLDTLPAWKNVAGGATIKQAVLVWTKFSLGRISLADKNIYYSLLAVISVIFSVLLIKALRSRNKKIDIVWFWFVIPLVLGFFTSFVFPAFIYFRFLYVLPAFYLLLGWGVVKVKSTTLRNLVIGILLLINISAWLVYLIDPNQQREMWKEAVKYVEENVRENEIVLFSYPEPFTPYRWYEKMTDISFGATDSISTNTPETEYRTKEIVKGAKGIFYFEYLSDLSDPNEVVENTIKEEGFEIVNIKGYTGVGEIIHYQRNEF